MPEASDSYCQVRVDDIKVVHDVGSQELSFHCSCDVSADIDRAADELYRAAIEVVEAHLTQPAIFVAETMHIPASFADTEKILRARQTAFERAELADTTIPPRMLRQTPLEDAGDRLVVVMHVYAGEGIAGQSLPLDGAAHLGSDEHSRSAGFLISGAQQNVLQTNLIYGAGGNAFDQTAHMFRAAETLLEENGFSFADVMRTWLYLPHMARDYADLNAARREFFESRHIKPVPASTGIGAGLVAPTRCIAMSLYAARGAAIRRDVMTTPTLNEAPSYGADFSRGMHVHEAASSRLFVSGTASLDETGQSVHHGDFDAQVDRMLCNVAALLDGQGASYRDILSAVTYVKRPDDAAGLREKLRAAGYTGFPNPIVHAEVCRDELLVETEALALRK